jgi:polyhydroxybutyrate depolymerase
MRNSRIWLLALVVFLGPACGKGGGGHPSPSAPPSPPAVTDGTGGTGGSAGTFSRSTTVNGIARTYTLYVPGSAMTAIASGPVPLVIAFHGAGDTGSNFIGATGLASAASSNGLILVGADGYLKGWFVSAAEGWPQTDGNSNSYPNDLAFATQIKDEVGALYDLSTRRVFACGFSRGAGFTVLLAEASGNPDVLSGAWSSPFAAYGVCAGYDPAGFDMAKATPKRPVWLIHGTSDGVVPYSYGESCSHALNVAGFPTTFTSVSGAPHNWLWSAGYGHSNQELIDFLLANPGP